MTVHPLRVHDDDERMTFDERAHDVTPTEPDSRENRRRDPYRQASGFLLGSAVGGMFFNLLSTSIGYRGVAVVALAAGLIAVLGWLRRLPPGAPLTRVAIPALLGLALVATSAALVPAWSKPSTIVAVLSLLAGTALATTFEHAVDLMFSVAVIGLGVGTAGYGLAPPHSDPLVDASLIGMGFGVIGLGMVILRGSGLLFGPSLIVLGISVAGYGAVPPHPDVVSDVLSIAMGLGLIGIGVGIMRGMGLLLLASIPGALLALVGSFLSDVGNSVLGDASLVGVGAGIIGLVSAALRSSKIIAGASLSVIGIAFSGMQAAPPYINAPFTVFGISVGIGITAFGIQILLRQGVVARGRGWLTSLTHAPPSAPDDPPDTSTTP